LAFCQSLIHLEFESLGRKEHSSIILQTTAAAQHLVLRIPMKHLVGIGVLIGMAFGLRCLLQTGVGFDIYIHDIYWVVPFRTIVFWCLAGTALAWFMIFAWKLIRRHF